MKAYFSFRELLLLLILAFVPFTCINSQGFYFNIGGGYGFNTTNLNYANLCEGFTEITFNYYYDDFPPVIPFSFTGANQTYTQITTDGETTNTNSYQSINKGFGGGLSFFASAGYAFTKNMSAEIGFSYLTGTTLQSIYSSTASSLSSYYSAYSNESLSNELTASPRYRLMPALKFSVPFSKFTPYLKAGLVVGLGGKLTLNNAVVESGYSVHSGQVDYETTETANTGLIASGGLSLGYTASAGVEYALANFLSIYCEINLINENWSPAKGDITAYSAPGVSTPYVPVPSPFTYSNNITSAEGTANTTPNVLQVNGQYPKQTLSYGSYGVAIGVKFSIPKKKVTAPAANVAPKTN